LCTSSVDSSPSAVLFAKPWSISEEYTIGVIPSGLVRGTQHFLDELRLSDAMPGKDCVTLMLGYDFVTVTWTDVKSVATQQYMVMVNPQYMRQPDSDYSVLSFNRFTRPAGVLLIMSFTPV
jgi:hypothetical protein